jgi:hypothetical protein
VEHVKENLKKKIFTIPSTYLPQPFFFGKKSPKANTKTGLATCLLYNVGPKS